MSTLAAASAELKLLKLRETQLLQEIALLQAQEQKPGPGVGDPEGDAAAGLTQYVLQSHPVLFQTPAGKVAGRVLVNETSLLFVEVRAKITPEEFVGIRSVNRAASAAVDAASQGQRGCHAVSWPRSISASVLQSSASTGAEASPSPTDSPSKQGLAGEGQQPYLPKLGSRVRMYLRQTWTSGTELDGSKCQGPGDWEDEYGPTDEVGLWEVLWKDGGGNGPLRRLKFEASARTRQMVHQHVENWAVDTTPESSAGSGGSQGPHPMAALHAVQCSTAQQPKQRSTAAQGAEEVMVHPLCPQPSAAQQGRPPVAPTAQSAIADALAARVRATNIAPVLQTAAGVQQSGGRLAEILPPPLSGPRSHGFYMLPPPPQLQESGGAQSPPQPQTGTALHTHHDLQVAAALQSLSPLQNGTASTPATSPDGPPILAPGYPLTVIPFTPEVSEPSCIMQPAHISALAAALPPRFRLANWELLYSTHRHGISLQTLFRRSASRAPTVLVVRDTRGYIFGCYTSDAWRVAPRYYGTGECFVYTLAPQMRAWHWERRGPASNNNFFMYGAHDSLAIGGGGHFALWLDNELMYGASGPCQTFASPCLSSSQDFAISKLELWSII